MKDWSPIITTKGYSLPHILIFIIYWLLAEICGTIVTFITVLNVP